MNDSFYTPGWMQRETEKRVLAEHQEKLLEAARQQHEEEQARYALLWQQEEEKRLLGEQRTAMALHRKEEKRLFAKLGVNTRKEYYRKKLANRSNDDLRELLHRKIARKKASCPKISPKKVRKLLQLLEFRRHVYSGRWLEETFRAAQFPPNEYHRERRIFAPPINRLSRDAQHRSWDGYEWAIV
mgnify:CR=1 FL=1|tara:strand:+ start:706 stop:1260 length:555 start_codon:yes stop_codon:yes gene_type:complete